MQFTLSRREFGVGVLSTMLATKASAVDPASSAYPSKPIKFVLPLSVGGGIDACARMFGERLTKAWGQPVLVEPKPGANGLIGATYVAKSPADGYTFLFSNSGLMQSSQANKSTTFHIEELAPVYMFAYAPAALAVSASVPAQTVEEFVALVRANPHKYSFGSTGSGSSGHLLGEMLNRLAKIDMVHVPYQGEAPAILALLGGEIDVVLASVGGLARHPASKVRMLAVANPKRLRDFPKLLTFAESGYPQLNRPGWAAILAPSATSAEVVKKMSDECQRIGQQADIVDRGAALGFEVSNMSTEEFRAYFREDYQAWGQMIRLTGVKMG